jgi:hypothetical protein
MSLEIKGPWTEQEAETFLTSTQIPLRLACVGADGFPRVISLWYRYEGGRIYCVTHQDSQLANLLRREDKIGFEIAPNEPPYHGLRGQAKVRMAPLGSSTTLHDLLQRYLGGLESSLAKWLISRSDEEFLITIEPKRLYSWDYRERMADVS